MKHALIIDYLHCLRAIQEYRDDMEEALSPYAMEAKRQDLHAAIIASYVEDNGLTADDVSNVHQRSKEIFDCLDRLCQFYDYNDEWKLKSDHDIEVMSDCIRRHLERPNVKLYLNGQSDNADIWDRPVITRYYTFGQTHVHRADGQTFDKDCVVAITAHDPRAVMFEYFGNKWAFEYDENCPDLTYFPRGVYDLTNHKWLNPKEHNENAND